MMILATMSLLLPFLIATAFCSSRSVGAIMCYSWSSSNANLDIAKSAIVPFTDPANTTPCYKMYQRDVTANGSSTMKVVETFHWGVLSEEPRRWLVGCNRPTFESTTVSSMLDDVLTTSYQRYCFCCSNLCNSNEYFDQVCNERPVFAKECFADNTNALSSPNLPGTIFKAPCTKDQFCHKSTMWDPSKQSRNYFWGCSSVAASGGDRCDNAEVVNSSGTLFKVCSCCGDNCNGNNMDSITAETGNCEPAFVWAPVASSSPLSPLRYMATRNGWTDFFADIFFGIAFFILLIGAATIALICCFRRTNGNTVGLEQQQESANKPPSTSQESSNQQPNQNNHQDPLLEPPAHSFRPIEPPGQQLLDWPGIPRPWVAVKPLTPTFTRPLPRLPPNATTSPLTNANVEHKHSLILSPQLRHRNNDDFYTLISELKKELPSSKEAPCPEIVKRPSCSTIVLESRASSLDDAGEPDVCQGEKGPITDDEIPGGYMEPSVIGEEVHEEHIYMTIAESDGSTDSLEFPNEQTAELELVEQSVSPSPIPELPEKSLSPSPINQILENDDEKIIQQELVELESETMQPDSTRVEPAIPCLEIVEQTTETEMNEEIREIPKIEVEVIVESTIEQPEFMVSETSTLSDLVVPDEYQVGTVDDSPTPSRSNWNDDSEQILSVADGEMAEGSRSLQSTPGMRPKFPMNRRFSTRPPPPPVALKPKPATDPRVEALQQLETSSIVTKRRQMIEQKEKTTPSKPISFS